MLIAILRKLEMGTSVIRNEMHLPAVVVRPVYISNDYAQCACDSNQQGVALRYLPHFLQIVVDRQEWWTDKDCVDRQDHKWTDKIVEVDRQYYNGVLHCFRDAYIM